MTESFKGLSQIDGFAQLVSLTLNGRKFHGTRTGGCPTVMLFMTVLAYWVWGTLHCFTYYKPEVFTANVPISEDATSNVNVLMGGRVEIGATSEEDAMRYMTIVFGGPGDRYYNSTEKTINEVTAYFPDTDECSNGFVCNMQVGYCDIWTFVTQ